MLRDMPELLVQVNVAADVVDVADVVGVNVRFYAPVSSISFTALLSSMLSSSICSFRLLPLCSSSSSSSSLLQEKPSLNLVIRDDADISEFLTFSLGFSSATCKRKHSQLEQVLSQEPHVPSAIFGGQRRDYARTSPRCSSKKVGCTPGPTEACDRGKPPGARRFG